MKAYEHLVVPLDGILRQTGQASRSSGITPDPFTGLTPGQQDMSGRNRKVHEPSVRPAPRMVMKVCIIYALQGARRGLTGVVSSYTWIISRHILHYCEASSAGLPQTT